MIGVNYLPKFDILQPFSETHLLLPSPIGELNVDVTGITLGRDRRRSWNNWVPTWRKKNLILLLPNIITKINYRWITDQNVKGKNILEGNMEVFS